MYDVTRTRALVAFCVGFVYASSPVNGMISRCFRCLGCKRATQSEQATLSLHVTVGDYMVFAIGGGRGGVHLPTVFLSVHFLSDDF